jgi:lysozyme family protein
VADLRKEIIGAILGHEGGYVNDPRDSGGATNWGITERVARRHGYTGDMRRLTKADAIGIYTRSYWMPLQLDIISLRSASLAYILFDIGVNAGVGRAGAFLQRVLSVMNSRGKHYPDLAIDGDIGGKTLTALDKYCDRRGAEGVRVLCGSIKALQLAFYIELAERREKDEAFVYGWAVRALAEPL